MCCVLARSRRAVRSETVQGSPASGAAAVLPAAGGSGSGAGGSGLAAAAAAAERRQPRRRRTAMAVAPRDPRRADSDAGGAAPSAVSCQAIKQRIRPPSPSVYHHRAARHRRRWSFCEMTVDNGGWTAFYIGDNGSAAGGLHFETTADAAPTPATAASAASPSTIDMTRDFAVKCDAAVVKFKLGAPLPSTTSGTGSSTRGSRSRAPCHRRRLVGKANLVSTSGPATRTTGPAPTSAGSSRRDRGRGDHARETRSPTATRLNALWNYCNGAADATERVMLFYR